MDKVRKVIFDPLATTRAQIRHILSSCPVGTAHPFSPDKVLLCKSTDDNAIVDIDISAYPDDYFYNAVDLGEMGEVLLNRMAGFPQLAEFKDYQILQAPASTFTVSTAQGDSVHGRPTILAVSERNPTYYDLCLADPSNNRTSCYSARNTFQGVVHSGDINHGSNLLHTIKIYSGAEDQRVTAAAARHGNESELCVFISGFSYTKITRFLGTHPALLVADHEAKVLYLVPVPLDSATIGDATLCCPLMIQRRDDDTLVCSILQKASTDTEKMCSGSMLDSPCFAEAKERACFDPTPAAPTATTLTAAEQGELEPTDDVLPANDDAHQTLAEDDTSRTTMSRTSAVIATAGTDIPSALLSDSTQVIRFATGLEFELGPSKPTASSSSGVVLPLIFGTPLEGPVLLATGTLPLNTPTLFSNSATLRKYYSGLERIVVVVDERMTDNARTLTGPWRLNAVFVVQSSAEAGVVGGNDRLRNADKVIEVLNATNINAVTALAGPQSLVLVRLAGRYYFYRGLGDGEGELDTAGWSFGRDVTDLIEQVFSSINAAKIDATRSSATGEAVVSKRSSLVHASALRLVDISQQETLSIILPRSKRTVLISGIKDVFTKASIDEIRDLQHDINSAVSQLQLLLGQKEIQALSASLVAVLSAKISDVVAPIREEYLAFIKNRPDDDDDSDSPRVKEWKRKKASMLGNLRKETLDRQKILGPVITIFASMVSAQTTSKRTHDLKRLLRQSQIQGNMKAAESMTFETLAEYLEAHASDMGVMLVNIETDSYQQLLGELKEANRVDASTSCNLDSRLLHLDGFDAGILIEQSQNSHNGPLQRLSSLGSMPSRPTMALPLVARGHGDYGSMLAWACWDEFVNLDSPYTTRWLDKCNEPHIAAVRIITRETLSEAVVSREHNFGSASSEIGNLMSALLMSSMAKLAAMRTTTPTVVEKAEDTVTRLMRGLFGNLLTIAGAGLKPMSMVWQLFGLNPQYDVPSSDAEWLWYEVVTAMYPYTGWPLPQFQENLEKLLDKVIVRVVTKNEDVSSLKQNRLEELAEHRKLRNEQLAHSRIIVEILMRHMISSMASHGANERNNSLATVSSRLLKHAPGSLTRQTGSYKRLTGYLEHLASGGTRNKHGDLVLAGVYSKRSAVFGKLKLEVVRACQAKDLAQARHASAALMDKHAELAAMWQLDADVMPMQNRQAYIELLADSDDQTQLSADVYKRVVGDAERQRLPWSVGNQGKAGNDVAPIDEAFVREMLTGETTGGMPETDGTTRRAEKKSPEQAVEKQTKRKTVEDEFAELDSAMVPAFLKAMQKPMVGEDVCKMLGVPASAMRVFASALNPAFVWEDLQVNFKRIVLELVKDRSNRAESRPARRLLGMGGQQSTLITT